MDNLSSADLDTSSKTPLYIGIAAVIIACTGVVLGWLGFQKASELEAQLAEVSSAAESMAELKTSSDGNSEMIRRMAGKFTSIESSLGGVTDGVKKDISSVKLTLRSVSMQAGTALKKVEALEKSGVRAAAPKPKPSVVTSGKGESAKPAESAASGETRTHEIQSGDNYGKLSTRYKVSVNDLIDANPGVDPRRLRIGQAIVIPSPKQ